LVGFESLANISNSYSSVTVSGSGDYIGGLIGTAQNSNINNSYSAGNVSGDNYIGGLAGNVIGAIIDNSYSTGSVDGDSNIGGFAGYGGNANIDNSYSTGNVSGSSNVGGFVGDSTSANIGNSFWNNHTGNPGVCVGTGVPTSEDCTAVTDDEAYFYDVSNEPMDVWDFVSVWDDVWDLSYFPPLQWEGKVSTATVPLIEFVAPTREDENVTADRSIEVNVTVDESDLSEVVWNWNGTNYTVMNDSLVLMYNFDNVSELGENDSYVVDVSGSGNNGSCSGTSCAAWSSSGKYGGGFEFDGSNDYFDIPDDIVDLGSDFTVSLWVDADDNAENPRWVSMMNGSVGFQLGHMADDTIYCRLDGDTVETSSYTMDYSGWVHVVLMYNGTRFVYVDGGSRATVAGGITGDPTYSSIGGGYTTTTYTGDGILDEVRIWNRALSEEEINQVYMSNLNKYDEDKWLFYVNETKNATSLLDYGNYTYEVFAANEAFSWNSTGEREVQVLNITPVVLNVTDFDEDFVMDGDVASGDNVTINVTLETNVGVDKVWVKVWEAGIGVSSILWEGFLSLLGSIWTVTFGTNDTFLGLNNYTVYVNNTAGEEVNESGNFTVVAGDIAPLVDFVFPTRADGNVTEERAIEVNVTIEESSLENIVWNWNGTNYTVMNDSLVLMYNFDNVSSFGENSSYVVDVSGTGNNGTVFGTGGEINVTGAAKFGSGGLFLNGAGDYVNAGNDASLNISEEITVVAWVKFTTSGGSGNYPAVVCKEYTQSWCTMFLTGTRIPRFYLEIEGSSQWHNGAIVCPLDEWCHVSYAPGGSFYDVGLDNVNIFMVMVIRGRMWMECLIWIGCKLGTLILIRKMF